MLASLPSLLQIQPCNNTQWERTSAHHRCARGADGSAIGSGGADGDSPRAADLSPEDSSPMDQKAEEAIIIQVQLLDLASHIKHCEMHTLQMLCPAFGALANHLRAQVEAPAAALSF